MMLEIIRDQWKIILPTLMPKYFEAEWRQMEDTSGYTGMETDRLKALGFNIKHAHIEHPSGFQSEYCSEDKVRSN